MAATLRFNKEFYTEDALAQAIADWEEVGSFTLDGAPNGEQAGAAAEGAADHFVVTVQALQEGDVDGPEAAEILGEFTNYVLSLEIGRRRK